LGLGDSSGKSGSMIFQRSSLTSCLAILSIYPDLAVLKGSLISTLWRLNGPEIA
jgi:hypothetical protein